MEKEGGEDVGGDGGEEEGPGGTPALGMAPSETDDGWVLREIEVEGGDHRRRRHTYHGGDAGR